MKKLSLKELNEKFEEMDESLKSVIKFVARHQVRLDDIRPDIASCPQCGTRLTRNDERCHACS